MASTRNKNTIGNYTIETRKNHNYTENLLYINSAYGMQNNTYLPGDGIVASKLPYTELANNAVDIETYLRGTGATNLININKPKFIPELKQLKSLCIYKKPQTVMPLPLIVETKQRPEI